MVRSLKFAPVNRLLTAGVLTVGCIFLTLAVQGGEKVRFSDGNRSPAKTEPLTKRGLDNPFGGSLDRDSSLGGVPAAPFSPVATPPRPLTPKEQDLRDQQNNWMQRSMEELSISEKTAGEAFGVRDYGARKPDSRSKGAMERYFDKADEKAKLDETDAFDASRAKESGLSAFGQLNERGSTERSSPFSASRASDPLLSLAAPGRMSLSKGPGGAFGEDRADSSDSLGEPILAGSPGTASQASDLVGDRKARTDGFRRMLNMGSPGGLKGSSMQGSMDPINLHPDLTGDLMNPVAPMNVGGVLSGAKVSFSDSLRPVAVGGVLSRSGALDDLVSKGQGTVSAAPSFIPVSPVRRPAPSPLVLEMPRRGF